MQPLSSTSSAPPIKSLVASTAQSSPAPIKDLQPIKPPLQKSADKSSDSTTNNTSLVGNEEVGLILLSLINQFIEQLQGVNTPSQAVTAKAEISDKGKTDAPHQPSAKEAAVSTNKADNAETGEISKTGNSKTDEIAKPSIESDTLASSTVVSDAISSSKPAPTTEANATQISTEDPAIDAETTPALEDDNSPQATNEEIPHTQSEQKPHPDGLRSLEKFKISLLGFSSQIKNDESQRIFNDAMPGGGKFETVSSMA